MDSSGDICVGNAPAFLCSSTAGRPLEQVVPMREEGRGFLEQPQVRGEASGASGMPWRVVALISCLFGGLVTAAFFLGAMAFVRKNSVVIVNVDGGGGGGGGEGGGGGGGGVGDVNVFLGKGLKKTHPHCADFPKLDILEVAHNNLANVGPGTGREGLEYHVKTEKGEDLYMDVHATPFESDNAGMGMRGAFGSINVAGNTEALLQVSFRDFETRKPAVVEDFTLSFFDLDYLMYDQGGSSLKALTIEGDWSTAVVAKETSLLVHRAAERKITFQASEESEPGDSPEDPNMLTLNEYNKAVTVRFQHADHFRIGLQVKTDAQVARTFEFIGGASILCAKSPTGEALPVGQVYVNEHQLKVGSGHVKHDRWWMLAMLSMLAALIFAMIFIVSMAGGRREEAPLRDMAATVPGDSESPTYRPPRSWC
eukprot:s990_g26.t1